jgi:hypothetical protein
MKSKEQLASEQIAAILKQVRTLIGEAESIADEAGTGFSFSLAYGMGGWYVTRKEAAENADVDLEANPGWEASNAGWQSSSSNC